MFRQPRLNIAVAPEMAADYTRFSFFGCIGNAVSLSHFRFATAGRIIVVYFNVVFLRRGDMAIPSLLKTTLASLKFGFSCPTHCQTALPCLPNTLWPAKKIISTNCESAANYFTREAGPLARAVTIAWCWEATRSN